MRKCPVSIFLAMSLDGFIAGQDGNLDFLAAVESKDEDYGYKDFINEVDTVIMGRKTYDKVLSFGVEFPHKQRKCYVFSNSLIGRTEYVEFVNKSPQNLIDDLRLDGSKGIYCDGGAELIQQMITSNLIDRYIISIVPVILGNGIALFDKHELPATLQLESSKSFPTGLVQLTYTT